LAIANDDNGAVEMHVEQRGESLVLIVDYISNGQAIAEGFDAAYDKLWTV